MPVDAISDTLAAHAATVRSALPARAAVGRGARDAVAAALAAVRGDRLNAVTRVLDARATATAADATAGPLAGIPFVAKDLFDVAGLPTTAGSEHRADAPPAPRDAPLIAMLEAAGAVLVGTANMDALAYGFATDNAWTGRTANPHDPARLAGGSSGGSAAAVAAGMVPLALGSDTNGSVRVPASLCGIYGLKPTHGRLPADGMFPFAASFDDPGPFAADLAVLRAVWTVASGEAVDDRERPLRIARLAGWFADGEPEVEAAVAAFCARLGIASVVWPHAAAARAGAFVMSAAEGGALHRAALAREPGRFDPAVRDRLIAGTRVPDRDYHEARTLMFAMRDDPDAVFGDQDVLIAPATPSVAPRADRPVVTIAGVEQPARSHLGIFTQPISFLGVPSLSVPLRRPGRLPLGVQLIARPGREGDLFALAARLEREGLTGVTPPPVAA